MRNYLMATSIALILPALSACSYLPGFAHNGAKSHHSGSYNSAMYSAAKTTPRFAHSLDTSYGYQASPYGQAVAPHGVAQGGCHGAVSPSVQYQAQPCLTTYMQQVTTPSHTVTDVYYQGDSICSPVGCAPQDTYPVNASYPSHSKLRGSYDSDYLYTNIGGVVYDAGGDTFGTVGRLGYQSKTIFGTEAEGSIGLNNTTIQSAGTTINGGVDYSVAAFALARLPVSDRFSVHARGGYHVTRVSADSNNGTTQVNAAEAFDGFAYGGGAEFNMTERDSIRVDYTRYEYEPQNPTLGNVDAQDTVSVAWARKF